MSINNTWKIVMTTIKHLAVTILFIFSTTCFALDDNTITQVHTRTKLMVAQFCKTKFTQLSSTTCDCLGDKAQANLDNAALKSCTITATNTACANDAVILAVKGAFTDDNLKTCGSTLTAQQLLGPTNPSGT